MDEKLQKILAGLEQIDKTIANIEADAKTEKAARTDVEKKITELGQVQLKLSQQLLELQQKNQGQAVDHSVARTLGEQVVKSDSYAAFRNSTGGRRSMCTVIKTAPDPTGTSAAHVPAYRKPGVVEMAQRELMIEALFPNIHISQNSVEFLKETSFTNNAAPVAEGALKPQSTGTFELVQLPVQTVPHFAKITKQLADDAEALAAFINARMVYGVDKAAEDEILAGSGTTPHLSGLMKTGNFVAQSFTLDQIGGSGSTLLDLLRMTYAYINANGYRTSAVIMNPIDWALIQGLKGNDRQYLLGSPAGTLAAVAPWGVPVIPSAAMQSGKYLAGDFARAATLYDRQETTIEIATQNEDDFVKNLLTCRAERRLALAVERPAALMGGNLVVPSE